MKAGPPATSGHKVLEERQQWLGNFLIFQKNVLTPLGWHFTRFQSFFKKIKFLKFGSHSKEYFALSLQPNFLLNGQVQN